MARIAAVQMKSTMDVQNNLRDLLHWLEVAAKEGAELVVFPENALYLGSTGNVAPTFSIDGPEITAVQTAANQYNIEVLIGSIPERLDNADAQDQQPDKHYNTSVLLYPASPGRSKPPVPVCYRKMHLFDVELQSGESYLESATVVAGEKIATAHTRCGHLGLSICYDLRFPELYRALVNYGVELFAIPSAFTYETGKEHWHTLLKARAIENLAYVIAPAQVGELSEDGKVLRRCFGHSLIIDPWGNILAEMSQEKPGVIYAEITLDYQRHIRHRFPCLEHRKLFTDGL